MLVYSIKYLLLQPDALKRTSPHFGIQVYVGYLLSCGPFTLLIFLRAVIPLPLSILYTSDKAVSIFRSRDGHEIYRQSEHEECDEIVTCPCPRSTQRHSREFKKGGWTRW